MKPRSLSARLTAWYILSAFALVAAASFLLYEVLASELAREDLRLARDQLASVRLILQSTGWPRARAVPVRGVEGSDRELYIRLIAPDGSVVLETAGIERIIGKQAGAPAQALGTSDTASLVRENDGDVYQIVAAPVSPGKAEGSIEIAMNHGDEDRLLARYRTRLFATLAIVLVLTAALGYGLARTSMRPIERIGRVAERIGTGNLHERIATGDLPDELLRVTQAFNTMLDRLAGAFARISEFSDDVAHELRTPVNNLRGQIEVALSRGRTRDDYEQVLGSCLEECDRLSRIIASLLFLARAGSDALSPSDISLRAEIGAVRDFYEASAAEAGLAMRIDAASDLHWPLDRTLFQQALANLVANAIAHSGAPSSIHATIDIAARIEDGALAVSVGDRGCGIALADQPRLFDRFFRADRARSGAGHAGLGLSTVKAIVERHGGVVELASAPGEGTRMTMRFPPAQLRT